MNKSERGKMAKLQQAKGFTRLMTSLIPETKSLENRYTKKEIAEYTNEF